MLEKWDLGKEHLPVIIVNALAVLAFTILFLAQKNYEFIIYIAVIVFFFVLILYSNKYVHYPIPVLWGLSLWSLLHMAGGGIQVNGEVLYKLLLIDIIGSPYFILKYDQIVHIIGFYVATIVIHCILKRHIKKSFGWAAISIVVIMAGLGLGALNEIIEFAATVIVPDTNVGGYVNTSLDLIADLVGAMLAMLWIHKVEKK